MNMNINPKIVFSNRLFQNVLPGDIRLNIQSQNFLEVNEGDIIYKADDDSSSLYLLIKGQVKIKFYGGFRDLSITFKSDNDFFGENEILEKIPRKSTAMAIEQSLLYVISGKELKELAQNKTIYKNFFNPAYINIAVNQSSFDESEVSNELDIDENNSIETSQETDTSFLTSALTPDEVDDDLSWNSSNLKEFENILNDDDNLNDDEVDDFSLDAGAEFDNDEDNLSDTIVQNEGTLQSIQPDESKPLFDSREAQNNNENSDDSIIDRIKEEIKESTVESEDEYKAEIVYSEQEKDFKPAISNETKTNEIEQIQNENNPLDISTVESSTKAQEDSVEYPVNESRELYLKITETLFDDINDPIEIIKRYAQFLIHKSSSAEANNILQKIIDQSNHIISSLTTYAAYLNERLELKSQILQASSVLDDILYLLAGYTELRKVKLYRKFEADASIYIDKNLLYQVCLQIVKVLCDNINEEGSIFVSVKRTKDIISLEFKSTGKKIPDEPFQTIFEPYKISSTPSLGLAQKIIHEHNGNITVKNDDIAGPEIEVRLPIVK